MTTRIVTAKIFSKEKPSYKMNRYLPRDYLSPDKLSLKVLGELCKIWQISYSQGSNLLIRYEKQT